MLESTILARCIGWLNCLFLGTGFLVIFSNFLCKPDDGSDNISEKTFILWTTVLILNLLTNIYLVLCVSIPSIVVWFAFTGILLVISLAHEINFLFVAVNVYIIIMIYLMIQIFKKLRIRKQRKTQTNPPTRTSVHNNEKYKCVPTVEEKPDEEISPKGDGVAITIETITIEVENTAVSDDNTITCIETSAV